MTEPKDSGNLPGSQRASGDTVRPMTSWHQSAMTDPVDNQLKQGDPSGSLTRVVGRKSGRLIIIPSVPRPNAGSIVGCALRKQNSIALAPLRRKR
jgi:hypothetical protein